MVSQYLTARRLYERSVGATTHEADLNQEVLEDVDRRWRDPWLRLQMVPGKDALSHVNKELQERYGVGITSNAIVEAMRIAEVPGELAELLKRLDRFISGLVGLKPADSSEL